MLNCYGERPTNRGTLNRRDFKTGKVIGATDSQGARASSRAYTPANIMANLYRHLGIDPAATLPDRSARPIPLLDDPEPVTELG